MGSLSNSSRVKAMSHEAICQIFCRKKYLQLGCQTYATCFGTCNDIIFYARRVFRNVSGILIMLYCDWFLLKKLRNKLQFGVSHAATCRVALRKVEAASTFSATCHAIFRCDTPCCKRHPMLQTWGVTRGSLPCNLQCNAIALQVARKLASCDMVLSVLPLISI